jgi:hypothetical protein
MIAFLYVGANRFREPNSLPLYVYSVPESLGFPELQFVSLEGEIMDEEIEDEGFAGNLRQEIRSPLAQDVNDEENRYTAIRPRTVRPCVWSSRRTTRRSARFRCARCLTDFFPTMPAWSS